MSGKSFAILNFRIGAIFLSVAQPVRRIYTESLSHWQRSSRVGLFLISCAKVSDAPSLRSIQYERKERGQSCDCGGGTADFVAVLVMTAFLRSWLCWSVRQAQRTRQAIAIASQSSRTEAHDHQDRLLHHRRGQNLLCWRSSRKPNLQRRKLMQRRDELARV